MKSTPTGTFNSAGYLSCRHTRGHNKSTSANAAIESLSPDNITVHKGIRVTSAFALANHSIVVARIDNNNTPSQGDVSSLKQQ